MSQTATVDLVRARADFPILATEANGHPLVYLDNAATSQKPQAVLDVLDHFWKTENANVHRGVHYLSQLATRDFDRARETVRLFLNASSSREVILTKGCTEGINLVASCLAGSPAYPGAPKIGEGDEILLSTMEHHSNIVPWQILAQRVGATVRPIPITDEGEIDLDAYRTMLQRGRVKMVGIVHVSNSLGTVNPVKEMVALAHEAGALTLIDGAQAGPHRLIDVQDIDADFYTLSCHKIYAPTGVGILYGKRSLLDALPPYHGGGDMIHTVSFEKTTYAALPAKYEAGTPNIAGMIGLGAAIDYLISLGGASPLSTDAERRQALGRAFDAIGEREHLLMAAATDRLLEIPGLRITGTVPGKAGIVSFTLASAHPHDIGTILDQSGIAIRAGHHCCMPLMRRLGVSATARASFAFYNTFEEVDFLAQGVERVTELFS